MKIFGHFHESWEPLRPLFNSEPLKTLFQEVLPENSFNPAHLNILRVFELPVEEIRVVILGHEPSIIPGKSMGYAYAVPKEGERTNELFTIEKELSRMYSEGKGDSSSLLKLQEDSWKTLSTWRKQGVLLLNVSLTVQTGVFGSHDKYWLDFTKKVLRFIAVKNPCVWMFWGKALQSFKQDVCQSTPFLEVDNYSREKIRRIPSNLSWNYILSGPSPYTDIGAKKSKFIGCDHFYKANVILRKTKSTIIQW